MALKKFRLNQEDDYDRKRYDKKKRKIRAARKKKSKEKMAWTEDKPHS